MKVVKFGGTSLASSSQFIKVKEIIFSENNRDIVVASAPGKRFKGDIKVTDLLYSLNANISNKNVKNEIVNRYLSIIEDLNLSETLINEVQSYFFGVNEEVTTSELISRGEYFNAKLLADYLGYRFIDSKDIIFFDAKGKVDVIKSKEAIKSLYTQGDKIVVPGFYGQGADLDIHLFSRGGSDITGSILANFLEADVYENWTDVSGVFSVNPSICNNAKAIKTITYNEIKEMSNHGANVLHPESILPCQEKDIPIHVLNTNNPFEGGTIISSASFDNRLITGIAEMSGFISLKFNKMNIENYIAMVLDMFTNNDIIVKGFNVQKDLLSLTLLEKDFIENMDTINTFGPLIECKMTIENNKSLVSVVTMNKENNLEIEENIQKIIKNTHSDYKVISNSNDDYSIIIEVDDGNLKNTISSLYDNLNRMELI